MKQILLVSILTICTTSFLFSSMFQVGTLLHLVQDHHPNKLISHSFHPQKSQQQNTENMLLLVSKIGQLVGNYSYFHSDTALPESSENQKPHDYVIFPVMSLLAVLDSNNRDKFKQYIFSYFYVCSPFTSIFLPQTITSSILRPPIALVFNSRAV